MIVKMEKKDKINIFNNKRGITLVSLIITIIIILILSGITIKMITGEHGLLSEAVSAREEAEIRKIETTSNNAYKYLKEESDNAFEEAINELQKEGYNIKTEYNGELIGKKYYVILNEKHYQIIFENDEIKIDR